MGFRDGAYAMVSAGRDKEGKPMNPVRPMSDGWTKVRLYISRKNRDTGEYEPEFSGMCDFFGTANAKKALSLKDKDRIKLEGTDVTVVYNKEKQTTYTNFKVFGFEKQDGTPGGGATAQTQPTVDEGEVDEGNYPF